jgi:hypothetical protein
VLFSLGKGINTVGELYEFIDQLVPASFYGNGAEFNFFTSSGTGNYWQFQGRMASTYDDLILNHNIYGSLEELGASRPKSRLKGFLPQDNSNERKYFYPDHGTQTEWGHLAGGAAGNVTQLAIIDSLNFNSISDLYGNWQKVNNIIFGQIQFNANVQPNDIDIFTFNLPHITDAAPSFMANGVANSSTGNHKFVLLADAANGSTASMKIDLIGNHSGDLDIKIGFSFSYSLGY